MTTRSGYLSDEASISTKARPSTTSTRNGMDYPGLQFEEDEEAPPLSWRLDPEQSHSDWTLHIQHPANQKIDTYHVHKNILGVGPWRADYFYGVFRSTQLAESQTSTSHIQLPDELAAEVMPLFLDFLYHHEDSSVKQQLVTSNAVPLVYLSKYFQCRALYKVAMQFLERDMCVNTLPTYVAHARLLYDETVMHMAATKCVDYYCLDHSSTEASSTTKSTPTTVLHDEALLETMDPQFLLLILANPEVDTCSASYPLSKLIAKYCQIHSQHLDLDTFLQLTDRKYTPLVHVEAALPLLYVEAALLERETNTKTTAGDTLDECELTSLEEPLQTLTMGAQAAAAASSSSSKEESSSSDGINTLTCLQKRCIHRLAQCWEDLPNSVAAQLTQSDPHQEQAQLSPNVLLSLLQESTRVAKETYHQTKHDWQQDVLKLRLDQENIVCGAIESEIHLKQQSEKIQREANEKMAHLQFLLQEKDRQLATYQREWDKLVRVPAEYSLFGDTTLSTYHHLSSPASPSLTRSNEPFDAHHSPGSNRRVNRFGADRPTAMPRIGSNSENGYLVVEQDSNHNYKRWPVFYYKGN